MKCKVDTAHVIQSPQLSVTCAYVDSNQNPDIIQNASQIESHHIAPDHEQLQQLGTTSLSSKGEESMSVQSLSESDHEKEKGKTMGTLQLESANKNWNPQMGESKQKEGSNTADDVRNAELAVKDSSSRKNGIDSAKTDTLDGKKESEKYHEKEGKDSQDPRGWSKRTLLAELEDSSDLQNACYVTAPFIVVQKLTCRIVNNMSSLVVSDSEELVSNVISIQCCDSRIKIPFPIIIAIPFSARYRGNYRDILVKVFEDELHSSYINPVSFEGTHNGQKGSFAEIKVYKLGVFSVVSCLRKENFTVPKKGLSIKLSMDTRISLDYLPATFNVPIIVQSMVQPVDATVLSTLKSKSDTYHSIVSTSPLLHIIHPSPQPFRKSVTFTLPCPPNPDQKKHGDDTDHARPASAAVPKSTPIHRTRTMSASVKKSRETANEYLILLGYKSKEEQWVIMEDITVRNILNGLVAFELSEHIERLIVFRMTSSVKNSFLITLINDLEEAMCHTMVNVVLYRKKEKPSHAVVAVVPYKELSWELMKLREEGYCSPPDPSDELSMREGEQLILKFSGNISFSGNGNRDSQFQKLTFHSQRKNRLELCLKEVDEFGNYSSPYYKGMAIFYKLTKDQIATTTCDFARQDPVCKLPLTLPKRERVISRPASAKVVSSDLSESLSDALLCWLSGELSEEDASRLVLSLRIRRSSIQLVKLRIPDNLTDQIYELLVMWRKSLPTSADKINLLSRYLCKCGRNDLVKDLQLQKRMISNINEQGE
ncbi:death domain-containing protein 1 isoform X2 [Polyodon spathula]|nr:death domain-containing protein 1 isoform X2 [Polyodon spathula]